RVELQVDVDAILLSGRFHALEFGHFEGAEVGRRDRFGGDRLALQYARLHRGRHGSDCESIQQCLCGPAGDYLIGNSVGVAFMGIAGLTHVAVYLHAGALLEYMRSLVRCRMKIGHTAKSNTRPCSVRQRTDVPGRCGGAWALMGDNAADIVTPEGALDLGGERKASASPAQTPLRNVQCLPPGSLRRNPAETERSARCVRR